MTNGENFLQHYGAGVTCLCHVQLLMSATLLCCAAQHLPSATSLQCSASEALCRQWLLVTLDSFDNAKLAPVEGLSFIIDIVIEL
jgi:hypothetical protein